MIPKRIDWSDPGVQDWTPLGAQLSRDLGEMVWNSDLSGPALHGEALRLLSVRRKILTWEEHYAAVAAMQEAQIAINDSAQRRIAEAIREYDVSAAEIGRRAAEMLRRRADNSYYKLGVHARRGVLLAADWIESRVPGDTPSRGGPKTTGVEPDTSPPSPAPGRPSQGVAAEGGAA